MQGRFYLTTPIYYASGAPHIGHAFTTIYGDVIARYHRQKGEEVFFLTGTDEHGSKIAEKAEESGKTPQEFVDGIAAQYASLWQKLNIQSDIFIRTTSEKHKTGVRKFFDLLRGAGAIYPGFYEGLYCTGCEDFITESKLVNGLCPDHLKKPEIVREKNYFFDLKKYLPAVREKILNGEVKILPATRRNEVLSIIDSGLPDFSITRDRLRVSWGIPYFYDDTQTIYVWVEALMNYVTALNFPEGELYKKFWPADAHIVGSEINKFHSIYWPAILLAAGLPLPKTIFVHGLFTVDGKKMSKTIGNIIDPLEMIPRFGADGTRYLLLSQFPASLHGDIQAHEFPVKYNADLANGVGNLFERVYTMIRSYDIKIDSSLLDSGIQEFLESAEKDYRVKMEDFNLFEALQGIFLFIGFLDQYINEKEPWNLAKQGKADELNLVLNSLFTGLQKIIIWLSPFLPEKITEAREFAKKIETGTASPDVRLNLFPRI